MASTEQTIQAAVQELAIRHRPLRPLVDRHGIFPVRATQDVDVFVALTRAIVYQQLTGKAAATIYGRLEALYGGPSTASATLAMGIDRLRTAGLSGAKARAVVDLAHHFHTGAIRPDALITAEDQRVIEELTQVRGIGPWTAQMFLLFDLGRLDVWPTGDLGVRQGFGHLFLSGTAPPARQLAALGEPFKPHRSILAWYCWRAADEHKAMRR